MIEKYNHILNELKKGHRPRVDINKSEEIELSNHLKDPKMLKAALCVLCHLRVPSKKWHPAIEFLLNNEIDISTEYYSFLMEAIQRHVIDLKAQSGDPVPPAILKSFNSFIKRCSNEDIYLLMDIISSFGSQSIYFKKTLLSIKWGLKSFFSRNQKTAIQQIEELRKKWPPTP